MLQQKWFKDAGVRISADLTLFEGNGNIFVAMEQWLALPFRTVPDAHPAAA